jgi:hypothetical protein
LAAGITIFAAAMLMFSGLSQFLWGIAALVNDQFLVRVGGYIYAFDSTTWGWIHLILGAGFVAVGIFILMGKSWAYLTGIILAVLNAVLNFLWLPTSPLAALVFIAINVLVVWALATIRRD